MKTQSATVNLMLLSKPNKQGLYPIVIRVQWNGRCEKRTGIAIPKREWSEKDQAIKKSYPNASNLNTQLQTQLSDVIKRKSELETLNTPYSAADLFTDNCMVRRTSLNTDYYTLMNKLVESKNLRYQTRLNYELSYKQLCDYFGRKQFNITELNIEACHSFAKFLQGNKIKNSSIITLFTPIRAIWNYAIRQKLALRDDYPFEEFVPTHIFKADFRKRSITREEMEIVQGQLLDRIIYGDEDKFLKPNTEEFALAMYVLGYMFGGLALVDMSNLKKSQIEVKRIGKAKYYIFNRVQRQKTNHPVPIIVEQDSYTKPLIELYLKANPTSPYLFPICSCTDPIQRTKELQCVSAKLNIRIKRATGLNISYYSCRHTFASVYMKSEGANPVHLATMMGRSVNGIWTYVNTINTEEELIKERQKMGL